MNLFSKNSATALFYSDIVSAHCRVRKKFLDIRRWVILLHPLTTGYEIHFLLTLSSEHQNPFQRRRRHEKNSPHIAVCMYIYALTHSLEQNCTNARRKKNYKKRKLSKIWFMFDFFLRLSLSFILLAWRWWIFFVLFTPFWKMMRMMIICEKWH